MALERIAQILRGKNVTPLTDMESAVKHAIDNAGSGLPEVSAADNGDVLTVVEGAWAKAAPSGGAVETDFDFIVTYGESGPPSANLTVAEIAEIGEVGWANVRVVYPGESSERGAYSYFVEYGGTLRLPEKAVFLHDPIDAIREMWIDDDDYTYNAGDANGTINRLRFLMDGYLLLADGTLVPLSGTFLLTEETPGA